jgi:hypothetical protein
MAANEELIAKVLELLPTIRNHDTVDALKEILTDETIPDIKSALQILVERGKVTAGEVFGRDASQPHQRTSDAL